MIKTIGICDRCKRKVCPNELKNFELDRTKTFGRSIDYIFNYDFCKDCVKELKVFLKQEDTCTFEPYVDKAIKAWNRRADNG